MDHFGDKFYIVTNKDGATNFKLMQTPVSKPGKANWKEVVPHRENVLLEGIEIFRITWPCRSARTASPRYA